jgi:quercetin dioxygenase-like cupin family protein
MRVLFRRIKRRGVAISTLGILGTAVVLAFGSQPIHSARAAESAVVTPLMQKDLADVPGKEMLMITVDYPPGSVDHVHRHDAHAFIYVLQGSIVMQVRGGKEVTLGPGQTFYEGPNDVHTVGRNASATEPAKFIVVLLKKKGVDVVLPAE